MQLLTHTSGYKAYYFETPMIKSFFTGRNDFYGITYEMVIKKIKNTNFEDKAYSFHYSNFGYAILGLILEVVYDKEYTDLISEYTEKELGLTATKISDSSGDLNNYWNWKNGDAYMSAGAVTSQYSRYVKLLRITHERRRIYKKVP